MNIADIKETYSGTTVSNVLKVVRIVLVTVGKIDPENEYGSIVRKDPDSFVHKKMVLRDNRIAGTILWIGKKHWLKIQQAIDGRKDIFDILAQLRRWNPHNLQYRHFPNGIVHAYHLHYIDVRF